MDAAQMLTNVLTMNSEVLNLALEGLSDEDLLKQPNDQSNPAGWLLWHQTRTEDRFVSLLGGEPQTWEDKQWPDKFGADGDPANGGLGQTLEQVKALRPTVEGVKGYAAAVREKTLAYLGGVKPADLDREIDMPGQETRTAGQYLSILISDYLQHCGQVNYLRGFFKGWGWFPV